MFLRNETHIQAAWWQLDLLTYDHSFRDEVSYKSTWAFIKLNSDLINQVVAGIHETSDFPYCPLKFLAIAGKLSKDGWLLEKDLEGRVNFWQNI